MTQKTPDDCPWVATWTGGLVDGHTLGQSTSEIERKLREGHDSFPQVAVNLAAPVGSFATVGDSPARRLVQQTIAVAPLLVAPVAAAFSPNY